jgi:hypothetical protein
VLDKSALFFIRLDRLSEMDPFEGYYTNANLLTDRLRFEDLPEEWKTKGGIKDAETWEILRSSQQQMRQFVKINRAVTFVNSWYCQQHESAAMWSQYLRSGEGIAIQSSYRRLVESLQNYTEYNVQIGLVKYLNYERQAIPSGNLLSPFIYKRKSFEHEREIRALIWTPEHGKNDLSDPSKNKYRDELGIYVPIDLNILVERVYLSPTSQPWYLELLSSLMKKYNLDGKEIILSDLAKTPIY